MEVESTTRVPKFLRKYKAYLLWFLLIVVYLYWALLPEVVFVNGSGMYIEQVKVEIPGDDKVWRSIEHSESKSFRYQPSIKAGGYKISIVMADGSMIKTQFNVIEPWNLGHKVIFEFSPDHNIRADYSYSIIE